jgi:hypothetical protein
MRKLRRSTLIGDLSFHLLLTQANLAALTETKFYAGELPDGKMPRNNVQVDRRPAPFQSVTAAATLLSLAVAGQSDSRKPVHLGRYGQRQQRKFGDYRNLVSAINLNSTQTTKAGGISAAFAALLFKLELL